MKYLMALIIIIISTGIVVAQNDATTYYSSKANPIEAEKWQENIEKKEQAFQDYIDKEDNQKKQLKNLKTTLKNRHNDVCLAYIEVITAQQKQLDACQEELVVFRFFSNTEETIFSDSTLELNGGRNKLKGSYLVQYETISLIREANQALTEVEETIETLKLHGDSKEDISMAISYPMKKTIVQQLDEIKGMDLKFLSDKQKNYYMDLRGRYNKIFNTYF